METIYYKVLLWILLTTATVTASAQSAASSLQGSWQMEARRMVSDMEEADRAAFDSLPDARRERLQQSFGSRLFEFGADGDFSARWQAAGKEQTAQGTWVLPDEGRLSISLPSGTSTYTLTFPETGGMVLEPTDLKGGMTRRLHFIKPKKP